ncbi:MAG: DUF1573 domain-containing protein [Planctomycetales bacterium]|nr:DUF1573 domain-containing protein [Planctomycetales bacterium]
MIRPFAFALMLGSCFVSMAQAQQWASKMFTETEHDFGTVARGAKSEFRFEFKNIYEETIHVAGVRTSCGCTTPIVENDTLNTYETSAIIAHFNTDRFLGSRSATLTVTIDKPYFAEVRLRVRGNIRGDIVVEPGSVNFDTVSEGSKAERLIRVKYAGYSNWQINDVRSANPHFEAEIKGTRRESGQTVCDLLVRLKDDAPAGYINDQLVLVTSDRSGGEIPVSVEGRVQPEFSVSPKTLFLGDLQQGEQVTKKIVVRGKTPFRISQVDCGDGCFEFRADEEAKAVHMVDVTFRALQPGKIEQSIAIRADGRAGVAASIIAYANVAQAEVATEPVE